MSRTPIVNTELPVSAVTMLWVLGSDWTGKNITQPITTFALSSELHFFELLHLVILLLLIDVISFCSFGVSTL